LDADGREEIERLFLRYGRGIGSYVLARVGDAELAEEITARVFLTVVRRFDQCRGSVVGWLWSIVHSQLARHFRDRRRQVPLADDLVDPARPPSEDAQRRELHGRMRVALAALSEEQRQIVTMKFFLKVRNVEIARAMGLSPSNVGVKVHRALARLREVMEGD